MKPLKLRTKGGISEGNEMIVIYNTGVLVFKAEISQQNGWVFKIKAA